MIDFKFLYIEFQRLLNEFKDSWSFNENTNREVLYMQERIAELEARVSVLEMSRPHTSIN